MLNLTRYLHRARSAVGLGTEYRLGRGGFKPTALWTDRSSDCSGFVAWVLGLSRVPKLSRPWWIETTAIHRDATGKRRVFERIFEPTPGCVVVYPDLNGAQGHVGIVASVSPLTVVDCSLGSFRAFHEAIREHNGTAFERRTDAIFVCLKQDAK
ncbi:MAG: CHAP domain-containing protein [Fimbriimonadaceae bacterium]|nr:CHAP domain-containing protein [Fimbriimonadaceae bacterium]